MADWRSRAETKRKAVNDLIPQEWRIDGSLIPTESSQPGSCLRITQDLLSSREREITESDALTILQHTLSEDWKAREVAEAFCHRAAIAHQLISCMHEIFFEAALKDAEAADEHFAKHKTPTGPLHGLPVSLKDQFHVKDVETSMGYVGWLGTFQGVKGTDKEKRYESVLVEELRSLGATLYCKTSVPHTLMCGETVNNIVGYTPNPRDFRLSVGGSSGGEGGLIALYGSPLGFGTDIGGSVRIPAAFNGLWGFKPSTGRLPYYGAANSMDGQLGVRSAVGPIARTLGDIRLAMKAILMTEPWYQDPDVAMIPWKESVRGEVLRSESQLSFGILSNDGISTPLPPLQRALVIVGQALEKAGHQVLNWQPPTHSRLIDNLAKQGAQDGYHDYHNAFRLSGEPIAEQVKPFTGGAPQEQMAVSDVFALNRELRDLRKAYMDYWNDTSHLTKSGRPVDAYIVPVAPFPAAPKKGYLTYCYTLATNVLDYPACVFPVTVGDKAVDIKEEGFKPMNGADAAVWEAYKPELYDSHPVCLQIVGRRHEEEKVLALAEVIEKALRSEAG